MSTKVGMTAAKQLSYEAYLAEPESLERYDIVDGVRVFMTNPTRRHQRILRNLVMLLAPFEQSSHGQTLIAPIDILIHRQPLRTRQPDLLFMSAERITRCASESDPAPLEIAPELVVEILSPSETRRIREDKLHDYAAIGVEECWVVNPETETVDVFRLLFDQMELAVTYRDNQTLRSIVFVGLALTVSEIFAS